MGKMSYTIEENDKDSLLVKVYEQKDKELCRFIVESNKEENIKSMVDTIEFLKFSIEYVVGTDMSSFRSNIQKTYFQLLRELGDWRPADKHITSKEEIEMLEKHFFLKLRTILDLKNLRDSTVSYYSALLEDDSRRENALLAMMSITSVIDRHLNPF